MEVYNKNRDHNNSMRDEIREQNAKLKDAPLKEKLSYFKDYYLVTTFVVIAVLVFIGSIACSMISAPDDTGFAAFFYNSSGSFANTAMLDEFVSYSGIDTKEHDAYIDATMNYNPDAADYAVIPFEDREPYSLSSTIAVNLSKLEGDTKNRYAHVTAILVLNKKSDSYETVQPLLAGYEGIIKSIVSEEVSKYNINNIGESKRIIQAEVLDRLRTEFESSDLLVGVDLTIAYE